MFRTMIKTIKLLLTVALLAGGIMAGVSPAAQADPQTITTGTMCMAGTTSCAGSSLSGTIDFSTGAIVFGPNTFSGQPWSVHNTSVQTTPGTYTFNGMTYTVGQGQIGAHMLMDWAGVFFNMDVAAVWNVSDVSGVRTLTPGATGPGTSDGGVTMVNGFTGQTPLINITTTTPADTTPPTVSSTSPADGVTGVSLALPAIAVTFSKPMNTASVTAGAITLNNTATVGTPTTTDNTTFTFSITSGLLTANTLYTVTFNPGPTDVAGNALTLPSAISFTTGSSGASATDDNGTATGTTPSVIDVLGNDTGGVASTVTVTINPSHGTAIANSDGTITYTAVAGFSGTDTFKYTVDDSGGHPSNAATVRVAVQASDPASSSGVLAPGTTAKANSSKTGGGLTSNEVGVDSALSQQCVGGCFDFAVTGLNQGDSVTVVLPLTAAIPANAVYRKLASGAWQDFDTSGGNGAIASAAAVVSGVCPAAGSSSYTPGLTAGNQCVQLTIKDGGTNDEDNSANGAVLDPGGVGVKTAASSETVGSSPSNSGGCSISTGRPDLTARGDWWLVFIFVAWLGLVIRRRHMQA